MVVQPIGRWGSSEVPDHRRWVAADRERDEGADQRRRAGGSTVCVHPFHNIFLFFFYTYKLGWKESDRKTEKLRVLHLVPKKFYFQK